MRLAWITCLIWCVATGVSAQVITSAAYNEPTARYPHGVLGDDIEYGNLVVEVRKAQGSDGGRTLRYNLRLPQELVFEDTAPRLVDVDGQDGPEIVVVESHQRLGARLAVFGLNADGVPVRRSTTDFIGQRNRWLAPVGVADFDADGTMDIALVDRPHLARRLLVFRYTEGKLDAFAEAGPLTNHRIGDDYIEGGVRDCGAGPEMIVLTPGWDRIVAVRWDGDGLTTADIAAYRGRASMRDALRCG